MKVSPDPVVVNLTQEDLHHYPFLYFVEPGRLSFGEEEVDAFRAYLLNGGFAMFDDFWGESEWNNLYYELKRVFPDREPVDLPIEHPIFHIVFDLKEKPQIPNINHAINYRGTGITWEREDARTVHFRGIFDDEGRMMVIICQKYRLGGWLGTRGRVRILLQGIRREEGLPHGYQHHILFHDPLRNHGLLNYVPSN